MRERGSAVSSPPFVRQSAADQIKRGLRSSAAKQSGSELVDSIRGAISKLGEIERQQVLADVLQTVLMPVWHDDVGLLVRKIQKVWNANIRNHGPVIGVEYTAKCYEKSDTLFDDWHWDLRERKRRSR